MKWWCKVEPDKLALIPTGPVVSHVTLNSLIFISKMGIKAISIVVVIYCDSFDFPGLVLGYYKIRMHLSRELCASLLMKTANVFEGLL